MESTNLPVFKGAFAFRVGAPSFIIPADILPNVRFLGPYLDEIELLFFESASPYYDCLPGKGVIAELAALGEELGVRYNVHLPTDLYLGDGEAASQRRDLETMLCFYERTLPLNPTCHVLHLERCRLGADPEDDEIWLERCRESLVWLVGRGVDPSRVAVENLEYPPKRMQEMVRSLGFRLCLDIGHLLLGGGDLESMLRTCLPDTIMIHLHGVRNGKDHRSLQYIDPATMSVLGEMLNEYRHGVSVEVFSLDKLQRSLLLMERFQR